MKTTSPTFPDAVRRMPDIPARNPMDSRRGQGSSNPPWTDRPDRRVLGRGRFHRSVSPLLQQHRPGAHPGLAVFASLFSRVDRHGCSISRAGLSIGHIVRPRPRAGRETTIPEGRGQRGRRLGQTGSRPCWASHRHDLFQRHPAHHPQPAGRRE